jgi:hypothetical protein
LKEKNNPVVSESMEERIERLSKGEPELKRERLRREEEQKEIMLRKTSTPTLSRNTEEIMKDRVCVSGCVCIGRYMSICM